MLHPRKVTKTFRVANSGFTLVEITLALAIILMIMSTIVPAVGKNLREEALRGQAFKIQSIIKYARNLAIATQKPTAIKLIPVNDTVTLTIIPASDAHLERPTILQEYTLPKNLRLLHRTWSEDRWTASKTAQWFLQPTGLMEPIQFRIEHKDDWLEFEFHPLTGNITEERFMFP